MKKLLAVLLILFLWTCEDSKKDPELPIVEDIEFTTIEDTGASFDLLGSDPNDEPFTYSVVTEPIHSGDLFISQPTDPSRSYYSPKQDYHGLDSLTYMATSRHGNSNVGKILITIIPADDDPTSNDIYVTMDEDSGPIDIELSSYEDIDGEGVQFSVLSENDAQYATISGNILTFNPPENFAAIYSLHLEISKATSKSILNRFYVYITVNPVNDPPIAPDMVVHQVDINEPGARIHSDIWNGSDIEYDALTYSIVDGPANGTIIFDNPLDPLDMRYTPNTNFFGIDTFTYSVNDGELETIGNGYIYVNLYNTYTQSTSAVAGKQTSDGGYIVGGGKDWRGGYVIKIDMWGNKEWDYYFIHDQCCGGDYPMINQIISMSETSDGGFIFLGDSDDTDGRTEDFIFKLDSSGNKEWHTYFDYKNTSRYKEKNHLNNQSISGAQIVEASDGSFFAGVPVSPETQGDRTNNLTKFDANGNIEWHKAIYLPFEENEDTRSISNIIPISDGGLVLGMPGGYVLKIDASQNIEWYYARALYSLNQTSDEGFVGIGRRGGDNTDIVKLDLSGNEEFSSQIIDQSTYPSSTQLNYVDQTSDGGYILTSNYMSNNAYNTRAINLHKTDSSGLVEWVKTYSESQSDPNNTSKYYILKNAQETSDGEFILFGVGYLHESGISSGQGIMLIKTDGKTYPE